MWRWSRKATEAATEAMLQRDNTMDTTKYIWYDEGGRVKVWKHICKAMRTVEVEKW